MRQAHIFPIVIRESGLVGIRDVTLKESPAEVEIFADAHGRGVLNARRRGRDVRHWISREIIGSAIGAGNRIAGTNVGQTLGADRPGQRGGQNHHAN